MSNMTWKKLWEIVIEKLHILLETAPSSNLMSEALEISNEFLKKSNSTFKIQKNNIKNKQNFIISLKNENYKKEWKIFKIKNEDLEKKYEYKNQLLDLKDYSMQYLISLDNFITKITSSEEYSKIIANECKILKETINDFINGLKKYNLIYDNKYKNKVFKNKLFNENISIKRNEKEILEFNKFIIKEKQKINNIFNERIQLYKTFYSLLEKINWEYLIFNLPIDLKEKFNKDSYTETFIKSFLKNNFNKYNFWIITKYDSKTEEIFFEKKESLLKKKYDNHVALEAITQLRNELEHGLLFDRAINIYLFIETNTLIGLIMELIKNIENLN